MPARESRRHGPMAKKATDAKEEAMKNLPSKGDPVKSRADRGDSVDPDVTLDEPIVVIDEDIPPPRDREDIEILLTWALDRLCRPRAPYTTAERVIVFFLVWKMRPDHDGTWQCRCSLP